MKHELRLADIGEGLDEAEIIAWLVSPGETVARDQPIVEVMTDKSNAELPAPADGTVVSLNGEVGDVLPVGSVLAVIQSGTTSPASSTQVIAASTEVTTFREVTAPVATSVQATDTPGQGSATQPSSEQSKPQPEAPTPSPAARQTKPRSRPKASPSTRREAARRGIDLHTVVGTGPSGRILLSDLDPPATQSASSALPVATATSVPAERILEAEVLPLRGVRRVIANNMHRSWSTIPHIHAFEQIDAEPLIELRRQLRSSGRAEFADLTPLTLLTAAVARGMLEHPSANASLDLDEGVVTRHGDINIGLAVASDRGLVVPVIRGAQKLDLAGLASAVRHAVDGARAGTLDAQAFAGGTVTITNFGSLGGEQATPLIRPPESVILGFGSIAARPWVHDGQVIARSTMHTVLGADHRLLDGDVATSLLHTVNELLQNPIKLVLGS